MLQLDTLEIEQSNGEFYSVTTNDNNIIDFKIDNDKVSLVKYRSYNDEEQRDQAGAILTASDVKCKE